MTLSLGCLIEISNLLGAKQSPRVFLPQMCSPLFPNGHNRSITHLGVILGSPFSSPPTISSFSHFCSNSRIFPTSAYFALSFLLSTSLLPDTCFAFLSSRPFGEIPNRCNDGRGLEKLNVLFSFFSDIPAHRRDKRIQTKRVKIWLLTLKNEVVQKNSRFVSLSL